MKIREFMSRLYEATDSVAGHYAQTCDTLKAGDPDRELGNVATAMFGTPDVLRAAAAWGASLLIVHEPLYYNHWDSAEFFDAQTGFKRDIMERKRRLVEETGLVVYRYHDHPHHKAEDMIAEGEVRTFGLRGRWANEEKFGRSSFVLETPMPVREVARTLERNLGIAHVRICGDADFECRTLGLCFGAPGELCEEVGKFDVCLTGEICDWSFGEFLHDCAQLGLKKAVLVMGHVCSEREGMRVLGDFIRKNFPEVETKYFESGDTYQYGD